MDNEHRMHKLRNGSDTAKWAASRIAELEAQLKTAKRDNMAIIDECEIGHRFAKLPDHPSKDGYSRCPMCMAIGLDAARDRIVDLKRQLSNSLTGEEE